MGLDGTGRDVLAGRYVLHRPVRTGSQARSWDAHDTTLDRRVRVHVLPAHDPRAEDFLDAARRAALVSERGLPRVLDAGTDADAAFVVEEHVEGVSMAELLLDGPMHPDAVRSLVGEAAAALDAAARRGLHHTRLTPESVLLCVDGHVRVRGTALEAALEPDPPAVSPARASAIANRRDALGLVALVYAGLTGRWPRAEDVEPYRDLPPAPVDGPAAAPIPPKDLRPQVPNDLDTLCAVTFGPHEDGPRDPGELSLQLAPWSMAAWEPVLRRLRGEHAVRQFHERLTNREEAPAEEPPVPFAAPEPTSRPPRDQSRFVLAVVAAALVLGLALAVWSLSRIALPDVDVAAPTTSPSPTSEAGPPEPQDAPEEAPAEPPPPPAPALLPVVAASAPDLLGDGAENGELAGAAIDGDPATAWRTEGYSTPQFGGLKDGVGLVLDLGAEQQVDVVDVSALGAGGRVELRTSPTPNVTDSQVVAEGPGGGEVRLAPAEPVRSRYLVLWFTELPQLDGDNRAAVAEVRVTGLPVAPPAPPAGP